MSSRVQFDVFYGSGTVLYGSNGVDLGAFKSVKRSVDRSGERSFRSICQWLERYMYVDSATHMVTVQTVMSRAPVEIFWELLPINNDVV